MMAKKLISKPRDFPSVEELLQSTQLASAVVSLPRPLAAALVKSCVARLKLSLMDDGDSLEVSELYSTLRDELIGAATRSISRVINATGVVVHTNLGRAPLSETLFDEVKRTVVGYGNVEYDIGSGARGRRGEACEDYLALLSGAETGTVVNNCAAALFIILNTLANRKKVLISRGELIQIGGGFRIPDILKKSGAKLCEIGTTNITTLADYENNIDSRTALILKVHRSNFTQSGFTEDVTLKQLVELGEKHNLPVINDLGSGVFIPTSKIFGYREPTVQESVRAGASLTCFSGDKMLGGMQAGLIVGRSNLVTKIKKNPIFRTIRVDKVVFAVLERLLTIYLNGTHLDDIKLWRLLSTNRAHLRSVAEKILKQLGKPDGITVENTDAFVGGGALPEQPIKSVGLVFSARYSARKLMKTFREFRPPVIGRVDDDRFILDLKAVDESDYTNIVKAVRRVIK
ncbi:MAG: L-seryl-tRNA(Sec) selenium transferase [Candidatus Zixiibacteriota bacterium]|nr:MAG: L-seryl-tRNA(Sec) selenium transferase [candidate division Zixibacteria bacterium]